jgi:carbon storage regulator CsrA
MLVLSMKKNDTVRIGPDITITIGAKTKGANNIKVCIQAPDHMQIERLGHVDAKKVIRED